MRVGPVRNNCFKSGNNISDAQKTYNIERNSIIQKHSDTMSLIGEVLGGSILLETGYSCAKAKFFPAFTAIAICVPLLLNSPWLISQYKQIDKLNKEYKSKELENKSGFDKFIYNSLCLKEGEVNDKAVKNEKRKLKNLALGTIVGVASGVLFALSSKVNKNFDKSLSGFFGLFAGAGFTFIKSNLYDKKRNNQSLSE